MKKIIMLIVAMIVMTVTVFAAEESSTTYNYVSINYGYSIKCPSTPKVVPAQIFYDDNTKKGDVLVFSYEAEKDGVYNVKRAWVILVDSFDTKNVPDFNNDSEETIDAYLTELQSNGYEGIALVDVTKDNKGLLGITAKEIEIDTNGDGKPDEVAVADYQNAVIFFRDTNGRCISAHLIGSDDLNEAAMNNFRQGLATFSVVNNNQLATVKKDTKADKKADKKDKSKKKDKSNKKSK